MKADHFIPPPADSDRLGDFAYFSSGADTPGYLRALNLKAHEWLLQHGTRGVWVRGRLRLPEWIHDRRRITFLARCAGLIISQSDLALPPERPYLKLVNRG